MLTPTTDQRLFPVRIRGKSMQPVLQDGDIAVVRPCGADALAPGDLFALRRGGEGLVVHRMLGWRRTGSPRPLVIEKGDSTPGYGLVKPEEVVGRVEAVMRPGTRPPRIVGRGRDALGARLHLALARIDTPSGEQPGHLARVARIALGPPRRTVRRRALLKLNRVAPRPMRWTALRRAGRNSGAHYTAGIHGMPPCEGSASSEAQEGR